MKKLHLNFLRLLSLLLTLAFLSACSDDSMFHSKHSIGYNGVGLAEDGAGDRYTDYGENPFVKANEDPLSTFAIDADGASYANMRGYRSDGIRIPAEAVRVEEFLNYFNFDYPEAGGENVSLHSESSTCPWRQGHYLLRIGLKGRDLVEGRPASNFVFLIDVSGSMNSEDKIEVLKSGFKRMAEQLTEEDRISIVTYSGSVRVALESVKGNETKTIKSAIDKLTAAGSTAGGAAIEMAYELANTNYIVGGNNRIILGTDGDFNVGVSDTDELITLVQSYRDMGIYLTICGVGHGNLNEAMMEQVANKGDGNYEYIDNGEQIYKIFVQQYKRFFTVAKDARIQVSFDPATVDAYRLIGYENRAMADSTFANDSTDAGEIGATQTITALYQVIPVAGSEGSFGSMEFRYKRPGETESRLMQLDLDQSRREIGNASENMRFAASVAGFGMLLKNSEYKGDLNYNKVLELGRGARSYDPYGFREEYLELVESLHNMD